MTPTSTPTLKGQPPATALSTLSGLVGLGFPGETDVDVGGLHDLGQEPPVRLPHGASLPKHRPHSGQVMCPCGAVLGAPSHWVSGVHSAAITNKTSPSVPGGYLVTGPHVPTEGRSCFHQAGGSCGMGCQGARPRLVGGTHPCRAGSWKRSMQNWTKAFRSVLLMPPMGLMSALEQSYLVR